MDWRDTRAGNITWIVTFLLVMVPKPWLTHWQNVGIDAVLIPFGFWLIAPSARRVASHGKKCAVIVSAGLLTAGLWGTEARAETLAQAYGAAMARTPCLTTAQRANIRAEVARKSFTLAAEHYAKRHNWAPDLADLRLYRGDAYQTILHDAVLDYLAYARKVGRAVLARKPGESCYQVVVASLRGGRIVFENEDELKAWGPLEITQFDGGPPGAGKYGGHGWGDGIGLGSLSIDKNFDSGPGAGCCFGPADFWQMGQAGYGWAQIVLGVEILGLPAIVQGITSPPLDLQKLLGGLFMIGKGWNDLKDAVEKGICGCPANGGDK